ncbi:unnamed protein product [marine sediment metagenome]|uniref:Phosphagen kinase C-terminal domain-containing protein n=1 Tax=marine sediment metagenome TaxID=412755 RepID=X0S4P6_9ZZZZ
MKIDDLLKQTSEWLKSTGSNSDIVFSSRVRLARNLSKFPFSHWASKKSKTQSYEVINDAIGKNSYLKKSTCVQLRDLSDLDKQFLVERHLMSKEHAVRQDSKALVFDDKEIIAVMINEEDHLRMQVMQSGFNLTEAWRLMDKIDSELSNNLEYAFSPKWGYLTACPTNVGTGLRASVMLHLPALVMTKQIARVLHMVSKLGIAIRGFYGEGTEAQGNFFQLSNQVTLGRTEGDLIDNLERIINQILSRERNTRRSLSINNRDELNDKIWRAYGTLKSAYIITSAETITLLSVIRLGVDLELIKDIDRKLVNELFVLTQPAHLQKIEGRALNASERDIKRAALVRKKIGGK